MNRMREQIEREIQEQLLHLESLRAQMIQTDAGIQTLQWVLARMAQDEVKQEAKDAE
jgi:hypothetical protein